MGYSVFSSKAFIFYKKCQICYLSGKVALKDKNSDRSGNNLNSKFTRGFLALTINLKYTLAENQTLRLDLPELQQSPEAAQCPPSDPQGFPPAWQGVSR